MDFKAFWTKFQAFWTKFRRTIYFRLLILLLVALLAVLLLQSALACLSLILIPVSVLLLPHWFGERSVKNHAINGLIFGVLATFLFPAIVAPSLLSLPQQAQAETLDANGQPAQATLSEGLVTPFVGSANTAFNFTVKVTSANTSVRNFVVKAQIVSAEGLDVSRDFYEMSPDPVRGGNFTTGKYFYVNRTLPPQVHEFDFVVYGNASATNPVVGTAGSFGPHNAEFGTHFVFWLYRGAFYTIFLTFGFFIILLLYWWTRKAREVRGGGARKPEEAKRAEGGGEFTCTNCGADVAEDAVKCPKCGAVFESEEKGEPADEKA